MIPSSRKLAVQSEPENAEIWIDGFHTANTPYIFEIADRDTVILELKMPGFQTYLDTIHLVEDLDLGIINLEKLFTLRISCQYPHIDYKIFDMNKNVVLSATGSRRVQLAKGRYQIAYGIGEGQYETKQDLRTSYISPTSPLSNFIYSIKRGWNYINSQVGGENVYRTDIPRDSRLASSGNPTINGYNKILSIDKTSKYKGALGE